MAAVDRKVFVGGLSSETTQENLSTFFRQFGEIEEVKIIMDKQTNRSKGYGFVLFREADAAIRAVANEYPNIDGKMVNCNLASLRAKAGQMTGKRKFSEDGGDGIFPPGKQLKTQIVIPQQQQTHAGYPAYQMAPLVSSTVPSVAMTIPVQTQQVYAHTSPTLLDVMNLLLSLQAEVQQLRAEIAQLTNGQGWKGYS